MKATVLEAASLMNGIIAAWVIGWNIVAQGQPDPIGGTAGWVGAGLLGAVLAWLLWVHLPAKDKLMLQLVQSKDEQMKEVMKDKDSQITKFLEDKDAQMRVLLDHKWQALQAMTTGHHEAITTLAKEFRAVSDGINNHCEKEMDRLVTILERYQAQTMSRPLQHATSSSSSKP